MSWEKLLVANVEAICSVCEAIAFYDYNVSSGPFFFDLWVEESCWLLVENGEAIAFYDYNVSSGPFLFLIIDIDIESETRGLGPGTQAWQYSYKYFHICTACGSSLPEVSSCPE